MEKLSQIIKVKIALISEFSMVIVQKVSIQKSIIFLYTRILGHQNFLNDTLKKRKHIDVNPAKY